ncbi:low temperature requirement protein A [Geodermatophilus sp. DSM 44513]|uniref:low temperature requirement protein A n=1 Tax=Geodermatophilus sp. DSM 44513 TaxID=1528104 RepID=UPI001289D8D1|nr:low temperature requirement protein A [Geodermatophilus sp. DSM 44513]WNV76281.1 low temperature requirement protein A [Geodermatophilus sp. DSM 44513]
MATDTDTDHPAPLVSPPRLRTDEDRTASRLELFLDLVYVLVVAQLASALAEDLTWHGAAVFAGLFTVTWWSWVTITLYANRFDTNDVLYRVAKLAMMFGVAVMAASATEAVGPQSGVFALGYLATRALLLLLYARAWRHVTEARGTIAVYLTATGVGAALWVVSLAVPTPARYWLWAAGILLEAAGPLVATRYGRDVPLHLEHLPERFGLFVILVLGESVASVVKGMYETQWQTASVVVAAVGFVVTAALWWSYFDLGGAAGKQHLVEDGGGQESGTADRYVYGHLPLTLGLAAVGVGIEQYVVHPVGELSTGGRWALCAGTALFLTGTAALVAGTAGSWRAAWPWPTVAIPVVVAIGVLDEVLPVVSVSAVGVALLLVVLAGIREQRRGRIATTET